MSNEGPRKGPDVHPHAGAYWTRPAHAAQGNALPDPLYFSVGQALSAWEMVEEVYASLFEKISEAPLTGKRVLGTIVSNSGKRAAITAAMEAVVDFRGAEDATLASKSAKLGLLLKHYEQGMARRTEIAHGVVTHVGFDQLKGYFLIPPSYNSKKTDPDFASLDKTFDKEGHAGLGDYAYTSADINHFSKQFTTLHWWVSEFSMSYRPDAPPSA